MFALLGFLLALLSLPFKSKSRLEAENAVLRRQLIVLQRKVRGRVHFTNSDRLFFIQLYRWSVSPQGHHGRTARDPGALAPCWLSQVLALETPGRSATDRGRSACPDLAHEHRKPTVGRLSMANS